MQQAFKPVLVQTPAANLLMQPGHTAVLWSPETLDASRKQIGVNQVKARHFVLFHDQTILVRDESEAIFQADLNVPRGIVNQIKTGYACAMECVIQWGARGVTVLESFLDVPPAKVQALEDKLSALGWFDPEVPLSGLLEILSRVKPSDRYEEQAISDLQKSIAAAITHREQALGDAKGEMRRAKEGKQGRAYLSEQEIAYYREAGFVVDEEATTVSTSQPPATDLTALAEMFAAERKATVEVFAEVLDKLMNQMKGGSNASQESEADKTGNKRKAA